MQEENKQPTRVQRTRKKGQGYLFPAGKENDLPIVYVGRGSKWGNPFKVGEIHDALDIFIRTNKEAVLAFQDLIDEAFIEKAKAELKGKNLACWCKFGEACHADILLKIANE